MFARWQVRAKVTAFRCLPPHLDTHVEVACQRRRWRPSPRHHGTRRSRRSRPRHTRNSQEARRSRTRSRSLARLAQLTARLYAAACGLVVEVLRIPPAELSDAAVRPNHNGTLRCRHELGGAPALHEGLGAAASHA